MKISNVKIIYKILSCFALLGLLVAFAIWLAASQMREMNATYSAVIERDVMAMKFNIQSNIRVLAQALLAHRHFGAQSAEDMAAIDEQVDKNVEEYRKLNGQARALADAEMQKDLDTARGKFEGLLKRYESLEIATHAKQVDQSLAVLKIIDTEVDELRALTVSTTNRLEKSVREISERELAEMDSAITKTITLVAGALALILALAFAIVQFGVTRPLTILAATMARLAKGDFDAQVQGVSRKDEIGMMARSVEVFKETGLDAIHQRKLQEEEKKRSEEERRRAEAEAIARERSLVAQAIGSGLGKLAAKDLSYRITDDLPDAYRKLQDDFNAALGQLEEAIGAVRGTTLTINSGTQEISQASDDLSRRTESQAANLEETAAAVAEITSTVKKTAAGAVHAREVVASAKEDAAKSGEVVKKAIDAMNGIEKSSVQITQIIGVIDEIAFQTNLLALNAGVEAARAGDAGRGFAVVASEVRALAQRSADAAKEIKALISASRTQVEQGVELVGETGTSLERIVARVMEINKVVADIASSAEEQATGLQEVNTAVDQMDQATQQNAAMVEEATAATRSLAQQSEDLNAIVSSFVTTARAAMAEARREPARPQAHKPAPMAKPRATPAPQAPRLRKAANANTDQSWEEF